MQQKSLVTSTNQLSFWTIRTSFEQNPIICTTLDRGLFTSAEECLRHLNDFQEKTFPFFFLYIQPQSFFLIYEESLLHINWWENDIGWANLQLLLYYNPIGKEIELTRASKYCFEKKRGHQCSSGAGKDLWAAWEGLSLSLLCFPTWMVWPCWMKFPGFRVT